MTIYMNITNITKYKQYKFFMPSLMYDTICSIYIHTINSASETCSIYLCGICATLICGIWAWLIELTQFLHALYTRIRFRMTCINIQGLYRTRNTRRKHTVFCSNTNNLGRLLPAFHPSSTLRQYQQFACHQAILHYCIIVHVSRSIHQHKISGIHLLLG